MEMFCNVIRGLTLCWKIVEKPFSVVNGCVYLEILLIGLFEINYVLFLFRKFHQSPNECSNGFSSFENASHRKKYILLHVFYKNIYTGINNQILDYMQRALGNEKFNSCVVCGVEIRLALKDFMFERMFSEKSIYLVQLDLDYQME